MSTAAQDKWAERAAPQLPDPWPTAADRGRALGDHERELRTRFVSLDPVTRVRTRQIRVGLWRDGELIEAEERALRLCLYSADELIDLLQQAGFSPPEIVDGYVGGYGVGDEPAAVFLARKPG